jgi:hypothetical protein
MPHRHALDEDAPQLTHPGACHLVVVPVLLGAEAPADPIGPSEHWSDSGPTAYSSFVLPPPEQRPRA